ncbi:MAG: alpha/beta hydrolase [Bacteroidota bacterium]
MKNRKIRIPLKLVITAVLFPRVEAIWPWLASRWFVKIFFSTARFKTSTPEEEAYRSAKKSRLIFENKRIQTYEWGEGKPVLFVHGWMGRATQFHKFIKPFNLAGFKVVSFDSLGHGASEGNQSHLMKFAGIVKQLADQYEGFEMIVGHSLGGVASLHAIKDFKVSDKLVMVASPAIAQEIVDEFRKKIGASKNCEDYFQKYIYAKYGKRFEEYSASYIVSEVTDAQLFLIYDENDREVSIKSSQVMSQKSPDAKLMITQGLGHNRILRDNEVITSSLAFLQNSEPVLA